MHRFFYVLSLLPLRVLYCLSDMEYYVVYYLIRYRRKIVRNNLVTSFPEKPMKEIVSIEKKFYRWFCDYFFEAIKLLSISDAELRRRFTITNSNEIIECFQQGQSVGAILGHYGNWEWLSCVGIELPSDSVTGIVYKPLRSKTMEEVYYRVRSHAGGVPIPKNDILRFQLRYKQEGLRSIIGYAADQGPRYPNIHLWLPFLNHDTGVFTGTERIMRKMQNAVFFVEMKRPKRGYYTCTYHLITREPQSLPEYEVTHRFFQMLEEEIRRQPEYYLWSHNRWKRTRDEWERLQHS